MRVELCLERRDVAVEPMGGEAPGELLEHRAHGEDLEEVVVGDLAHTGAAKRLRLDEAQQLEVTQRLAHRRLARAELGCDPRLDEQVAGPQLTTKDALEQDLLDLLAEDGARDRAHKWPIIDHRSETRQAQCEAARRSASSSPRRRGW